MRCKKHAYQAGGGVCATCLRDRLVALEAAQSGGGGGDAASSSPPSPASTSASAPAQRAPPPVPPAEHLAFPRSVSPYVSRRKSDTSGGGGAALRHHPSLLFFRTPQVGPSYGGVGGGAFEEGDIAYEYEKRRARKFSVLATLFGHHHHHHHRHRSEEEKHQQQEAAGAPKQRNKHSWLGPSWLAGIISRRRKKHQAAAVAWPQSAPPRRSTCRAVSNRGLSPERDSHGSSGDESSSSPAADPPWRPSPSPMRRTPCRQRRQTSSMPSGFAVCLSPLVRPSPGRRHRHVQPPDPGSFSCELRPSPLHSLASAASVTRCRSRKLADGGRFR